MKDTLSKVEELIRVTEYLVEHTQDEHDKEIHQTMLDVAVASYFMYASKNWN